MKKKNLLKALSMSVLLVLAINMTAQEIIPDDSYNYAYQQQLNYLIELADEQGKELIDLPEYKHFCIWARDYETKLDQEGKLSIFGEAIESYYQDNSDVEGDFELDWEYNSPDSLWRKINGSGNTNSGQGLIITLWISPSDTNHILAGGQFCGGLWETIDGGDRWFNITEDYWQIQGISSIFVNPQDTQKIFVTTSYDAEGPRGPSYGLYYTTNGGDSWEFEDCGIYPKYQVEYSPRVFLQNPENDSIMYLLTPYILYKSNDNGENWQIVINKSSEDFYDVWSARRYFDDMIFDPSDYSTIYVTGPEAFRIENNGQDVFDITDSLLKLNGSEKAEIIMVDADIKYPDSVWFSFIDTIDKKTYVALYDKVNDSYTVKLGLNSTYIGFPYLKCEVSPQNPDYIIIGGAGPYCFNFSNNHNKYYSPTHGFHNDIRAVEWPESQSNFALFGTDGGITKIFDVNPENNTNFKFKYIANDGETGIRNIDVQGFDVSKYGEEIMVIGTSHDCNIRKKDDVFLRVFGTGGGDVQSVLIDPENPNIFYAVQYGHPEIEFTINMGETSSTLFDDYTNSVENPPILFFKPNDPKTLFAGYEGQIWEFDINSIINIDPNTPNRKHTFPDDSLGYRFIKEVGENNDLNNLFFISTNRFWMSWVKPTGWYCPPDSGNPHNLALLRVEIVDTVLNFTDISENLDNGLCYGPITGIAIEVNENDTIIYTSFGGTSSSQNAQESKKVYCSNDVGLTWFAMAEGLPDSIPVNDIQYHRESGMLFLASDVGIYYYDRMDTIWRNITDNLPPMTYSKIRFSFLKNKILVGSHAKGVWEADLPCFYDSIPDTILTSKTWNCSVALHSDLIIETGATLTIKKEVYVPSNAKIIVKRGGNLFVDGGKITSSCGEMWQGIEVWGDPTLPSLGDYQGMVVVTNEGTIENAIVGIKTVKMIENGGFSIPDLSYAGGIVQTLHTNFINNKTAISYYKYPATGYAHIYSGFNYFSHFESNDNYIGSTNPDYFIRLNDVDKVNFKACEFENKTSQHHFQSGIYSFNSQFILESNQIGGTTESCLFRYLNYGVYALATTPNRFPDIRQVGFEMNFNGVYMSGISYATITDCNFASSPFNSNGYGLYLDACKNYWVEGNSFNQSMQDAIGIVVNDTRPTGPEMIYRNNFHGLKFGIIAQNRNRNRLNTGLVLKCNEYDNTHWNEVVICKLPVITAEYGIAPNQGANVPNDDAAPAGNLFSYTGPLGVATDIYNDANNIIYYYHDDPDYPLEPQYFTETKVNPEPVPGADWNDSSCPPSNDGDSGGQVSESELIEDLALSDFKVDSIQGVINILKDGGSTEDMKWEVDMSTPPETYEVYNELMNNSPYISDTVMEAAIEKEAVLPNVMIRDVMVANPHNAKNEELMTRIEERSDPMPEYMKAQILQGRSLISVFEDLQSEYAFYKQKRKEIYTQLVATYLNDTLNPETALDSLESFLANELDLSAKYQQAALSVEQGAWGTSLDLINNLPQQFNMTEEEAAENDQIEELYSMMAQLATEGKTMMDASSAQLIELAAIEASETGSSSVYSRNILFDLNAMDYEEPILLPDAYKSAEIQQEHEVLKQTLAEHHYLKVFPNPAGDYLIIEHNLEKENESAYIEISNVKGKTTRQVQLTGKHNQLTVDIKMLEPGVYISTLFNDKKEIESVKFTKVK